MESLVKMHNSYPVGLADWVKEKISEFHVEFIYGKYKDDLNELLELDMEEKIKKQCFKYYAKDFKRILIEDLFK